MFSDLHEMCLIQPSQTSQRQVWLKLRRDCAVSDMQASANKRMQIKRSMNQYLVSRRALLNSMASQIFY